MMSGAKLFIDRPLPFIYELLVGIMTTGAINVVRGSRSTVKELLQIYNHSDRYVQVTFLLVFYQLIV